MFLIFFSNKIYSKLHPPSNKDQDLRKCPPDTSHPSHSESQIGSLCGSLSGTPQREVPRPTPPPLQASGVTLLPSPCTSHAPPYPLLPGQGAEPELEAAEGWWRQRRVKARDPWLCPMCLATSSRTRVPCATSGDIVGSSPPPWASLVAQTVKNLLAIQETRVRSLGWEDPLEKGMATHSSVFAWRIPWTEEAGGLQSLGSER